MNVDIDFYVLPTSPKTLAVYDDSDWSYASKKTSYIQIIPPGSQKCTTLTFRKNNINNINAKDLGLGCGDLPDGIYEIKVQSRLEDSFKEKYYLKTDTLEFELSKKIIKINELSYFGEKEIESIFKLKWLLEVAKSYIKDGNYQKAVQAYGSVKSLANSINCKEC